MFNNVDKLHGIFESELSNGEWVYSHVAQVGNLLYTGSFTNTCFLPDDKGLLVDLSEFLDLDEALEELHIMWLEYFESH